MNYYLKDYADRWLKNKDVFVYGALTGVLIYWLSLKYISKKI